MEDIDRLSRKDAPDVPAGDVRALVRVNLQSVLKAPAIMPQGAAWLWQGGADARGRSPFAKGDMLFVFASPLTGGANPSVQALTLISPGGQQRWTPDADALVRDILLQAQQPGAAGLMVTGLSDAFHARGDLPGNSESQFFLTTSGGPPMVLLVRRKAAQSPEVRAGSGDLVERAGTILPKTLLWRALACGLPAELPPRLADDLDLVADYALARQEIGNCGRTLAPPA